MTQPDIETRTVPPQTLVPPSPPFSLEVTFPEGAPPLHNEAPLICTVNSMFDLINLNVEIRLPESLLLIDGELTWLGDIKAKDKPVVIQAHVRAIDIGNWAIQVRNSMELENQVSHLILIGWMPYMSRFIKNLPDGVNIRRGTKVKVMWDMLSE